MVSRRREVEGSDERLWGKMHREEGHEGGDAGGEEALRVGGQQATGLDQESAFQVRACRSSRTERHLTPEFRERLWVYEAKGGVGRCGPGLARSVRASKECACWQGVCMLVRATVRAAVLAAAWMPVIKPRLCLRALLACAYPPRARANVPVCAHACPGPHECAEQTRRGFARVPPVRGFARVPPVPTI